MTIKTAHRLAVTLIVVAAVLLVSPARSQATTIVYTDKSAFLAAAGNVALLTFDKPALCIATSPGQNASPGCVVDYGLVSIFYDYGVAPIGPSFILPDGPFAGRFASFIDIEVLTGFRPFIVGGPFETPTMAFGFDVFARSCCDQGDLPIHVNGLIPGGVDFPEGASFWGVVSDSTPFPQLLYQEWVGDVYFDNMLIGVPDTGSTLLLLLVAAAVLHLVQTRAATAASK